MLAAMRYRLGDLEFDTERFELRAQGTALAVEPQVLAVLQLLVEQRDRLVSKDDLIARVWGGRIVSDAAIASRIKSARAALGDDGTAQRMIRTVHGRGFRYVGEVVEVAAPTAAATPPVLARPALAVLPFGWIGAADAHAVAAEAIPHELIAELARLRWLHVIARGSSFRLGADGGDVRAVGERLGVRYCVSGTLEAQGPRVAVAVELADTRDAGVVWAER
jgi:DNA-binding winged helix-turn-helix (wHTH) protein